MRSNEVSRRLIIFGFWFCVLCAVWSPEPIKWILSGFYLLIAAKYFGWMKKEPVVGLTIWPDKKLNYLNLRKK